MKVRYVLMFMAAILLVGSFGCQLNDEGVETIQSGGDTAITRESDYDIEFITGFFQWAISDRNKTKNIYFKVYDPRGEASIHPSGNSDFIIGTPRYVEKFYSDGKYWNKYYMPVRLNDGAYTPHAYRRLYLDLKLGSYRVAHDTLLVWIC